MNKIVDIILSFLKSILILWLPVLWVEETFLYNYIGDYGTFIFSIIAFIICLIVYIKTYKKETEINCYLYNIINSILLIITNIMLGYLFLYLIDLGIFHQCPGSGWECFLFGIEYIFIGFEYAFLTLLVLVIWLFVRLIKYFISKKNK